MAPAREPLMLKSAGLWLLRVLAFMAFIIFGAVFLAYVGQARAHDWYPLECCHDRDCYPISASEVRPVTDGRWLIVVTNETVKASGFSPDGGYHRCSYGGLREAATICLFIPLAVGS